MPPQPRNARHILSAGLALVLAALACNLSGAPTQAPPTPSAPPPTLTVAPATLPAVDVTAAVLDPCALLTPAEAEAMLGGPVTEPKISGGGCVYSEAATGATLVTVIAGQGPDADQALQGEFFLLSAFGLQTDQAALDEVTSLSAAGNFAGAVEKLTALSPGNAAFNSQAVPGLGQAALWAWKEFGPVRQSLLVAARGDVVVAVNLVLTEQTQEAAALESAQGVAQRMLERLPPKFVLPVPEATETPVPVSPTLEPPTATPVVHGALILFETDREGGSQIYVMNADGSDQHRLINSPVPANNYAPAWSPDGSRIAFISIRESESASGLYVVNADGTGETQLTDRVYDFGGPAWSPDGSKLAFVTQRDGNLEIYTINADGSGLTNLTNSPAVEGDPAWMPDGSGLVFTSDRPGILRVFAMNSDGSGVTQLSPSGLAARKPAPSPDSAQVAFVTLPQSGFSQIYSLTIGGTEAVNLTNNDMANHAPSWSPDGLRLAYHSAVFQGNWDIYTMNSDGSGQTQLNSDASMDSFPAWQP